MTELEYSVLNSVERLNVLLDPVADLDEIPTTVRFDAAIEGTALGLKLKALAVESPESFRTEFMTEFAQRLGPALRPLFLMGGIQNLAKELNVTI